MSNQIGLKKVVFAAVAAMCGAFGAFGATYYAAPDVAIGEGSGTEIDPWNLYSALTGLDASTEKDELVLKAGTYDLSTIYPSGANIVLLTTRTKDFTIRGETDDCSDVVIDGKSAKGLLNLSPKIQTTLCNATFSNCFAGADCRASVLSNPTRGSVVNVSNCVFYACRVFSEAKSSDADTFVQGGAIFLDNGRISNCAFEGCMVSNTLDSAGIAFGGAISGRQVSGCVVEDSLFRNCKTYSTASAYPSSWSVCGAAGGGAIFTYSGSCVVTNCYFESCRAEGSSGAKYVYGGAICTAGSDTIAYNSFFTNCYVKSKAGALNHCTVVGCTIVDCKSDGEIGAVGIGGFRIQNSLVERCGGSSIVDGEWNGGNFLDSVFRTNVVTSGSESPFSVNGASGGSPASGHVVSNCVFVNNVGKSVFSAGSVSRDLQFLDNIFVGNSCSGHGVIYVVKLSGSGTSGLRVRNCYFGPQDYMFNAGMFYDNAGSGVSAYASIENCSFVHYQNSNIYGGNKTPQERTLFKNCFFWNLANKSLPDGFQNLANVTNCVFVKNSGTSGDPGQYVNLDPQYGNRVFALNDLKLKGGNKKFDWNSKVQDVKDYDWRPTKESSFVDSCTNQFDIAWAQRCSKKKGPWDIGDGTWTEKPYATVTIGKGTSWEKTFQTGVVITRNNANPRRYNGSLDVGCFEYWTAPGLMLLVK